MGHYVLRVVKGNATGTELPIEDDVLLGRSAGKPGNLGNDATLSRRHAMLRRQAGGELELEDLGSHNGTRVNGDLIGGPCSLNPGDRVELGETTLELVLIEVVAAPEPQPAAPRDPVPGEEPVELPRPGSGDQPARLGEVPVEAAAGSRDQPTRLGEMPVRAAAAGSRDQPTRLGEVPVEAAASGTYEPQPTRVRQVPRELAGRVNAEAESGRHTAEEVAPPGRTNDQATRLGRVPDEPPPAGTKDQATRLGRVPQEPPPAGTKDQATRLGRVPEEPPPAGTKDQATRLGRVPEEPPAAAEQPTRGGAVPAEPPDWGGGPEPSAERRPWWKRLFGRSG